MPPDLVPALATLLGAVEHGIGDGGTALAPSMETGHGGIPDHLARAEPPYLSQPDTLPFGHVPPSVLPNLA
jgi:hypothetical protein